MDVDPIEVLEQHTSPDGLFLLSVSRDQSGDTTIGFDGFQWHTHPDVLAPAYGVSEEAAVQQFVADILEGRLVMVVCRVASRIHDVWVTDDIARELKYLQGDEDLEFRYWGWQPRSGEII